MNRIIIGAIIGYMFANKKSKGTPIQATPQQPPITKRPPQPITPSNPIIITREGRIIKPQTYGKR